MADQDRYDWMHPSWRDVVIGHLMRHPDQRRRFLRRAGTLGLQLALSVSGGATGELEQPLLRSREDWAALRLRMLQLVAEQNQAQHRQLLQALNTSLDAAEGQLKSVIEETASQLCQALVVEWDSRDVLLGTAVLRAFYALSERLGLLPASPQLGRTVATRLQALREEPDEPFDEGDLAEILSGLAVVAQNEPRALRRAGWPTEFAAEINQIIRDATAVCASSTAVADRLGDEDDPPDVADAESASDSAYRWRLVVSSLDEAGAASDKTRRLIRDLQQAEDPLGSWLQVLEERAQDEAEDWLREREHEPDYQPADVFNVDDVLADL